MILQIENAFLTMLRLAILLAACVLLAASVLLAISALPALFPAPPPSKDVPAVEAAEIVAAQFSVKPKSERRRTPEVISDAWQSEPPMDELTERIALMIENFVSEHGDNESVDKREVAMFIENMVSRQPYAYRDIFKNNMANIVQALSTNNNVIIHATASSAANAVNKIIGYYAAEFTRQVERIDEQNKEAQREYRAQKAAAMQRLILAAGAVGSLLSTIFLLVFIRIERNLRPLTALASTARQESAVCASSVSSTLHETHSTT